MRIVVNNTGPQKTREQLVRELAKRFVENENRRKIARARLKNQNNEKAINDQKSSGYYTTGGSGSDDVE